MTDHLTATLRFYAPNPAIVTGAEVRLSGDGLHGYYHIVGVTMEQALEWDFSEGLPGKLVVVYLYHIVAAPPRLDLEKIL